MILISIITLHYRTWADNLPFEIPFGFATTFKSDEDWLDDWEELEEAPRKYSLKRRLNKDFTIMEKASTME